MPEIYDEEAVQEILRLAMVRQGQDGPLPRSQLLDIAEELGISESTLAAAEEEWQIHKEEQVAREDFNLYRHQQLRQGIVRFIVINSFLTLLNLLTSHTVSWVVYPVIFWSMAIAFQTWQTFQTEGEEYDRAFRRWRLRQQIGASFKAIYERIKLTWTTAEPVSVTAPPATNSSSSNGAAVKPSSANPKWVDLEGSAVNKSDARSLKGSGQNRLGMKNQSQNPIQKNGADRERPSSTPSHDGKPE